MRKKFWFKLSGVLLVSVLSLSFTITWFISAYQSRHFNHQTQHYLSERFSLLYSHIQVYLKKKEEPSFSQLQKILSLYFANTFNNSAIKVKEGYSKEREGRHFIRSFVEERTKKFVFLLDNSGLIMAHSKPEYSGKSLSQLSAFFSLIKQNSEGWNQIIKQNESEFLITIAQPININSVKYFIIAGEPAKKTATVFLSYFKWSLLIGFLSFFFLFLMVFLYLRSFIYAAHFLFCFFRKTSEIERKQILSCLAHTNNIYLKRNRMSLVSFLRADHKKGQQNTQMSEATFSDIINKAIHQSDLIYPNIYIYKDLISDITLPVFSNQLFQSLWELIKNVAQVIPEGQKGEMTVRTFKKGNNWFCCEVEDKGPGMDKETMGKAAKLYFTTKEDSTGLGLPFVQSVLSRMGGIMKLQSSENGGLKVCLFIPMDYINHVQNLRISSQEGVNSSEIRC